MATLPPDQSDRPDRPRPKRRRVAPVAVVERPDEAARAGALPPTVEVPRPLKHELRPEEEAPIPVPVGPPAATKAEPAAEPVAEPVVYEGSRSFEPGFDFTAHADCTGRDEHGALVSARMLPPCCGTGADVLALGVLVIEAPHTVRVRVGGETLQYVSQRAVSAAHSELLRVLRELFRPGPVRDPVLHEGRDIAPVPSRLTRGERMSLHESMWEQGRSRQALLHRREEYAARPETPLMVRVRNAAFEYAHKPGAPVIGYEVEAVRHWLSSRRAAYTRVLRMLQGLASDGSQDPPLRYVHAHNVRELPEFLDPYWPPLPDDPRPYLAKGGRS